MSLLADARSVYCCTARCRRRIGRFCDIFVGRLLERTLGTIGCVSSKRCRRDCFYIASIPKRFSGEEPETPFRLCRETFLKDPTVIVPCGAKTRSSLLLIQRMWTSSESHELGTEPLSSLLVSPTPGEFDIHICNRRHLPAITGWCIYSFFLATS